MRKTIADRVYPGNREWESARVRNPSRTDCYDAPTFRPSIRHKRGWAAGASPVRCGRRLRRKAAAYSAAGQSAPRKKFAKSFKSGIVAIIRSGCGRLAGGKRYGQRHHSDYEHTTGNQFLSRWKLLRIKDLRMSWCAPLKAAQGRIGGNVCSPLRVVTGASISCNYTTMRGIASSSVGGVESGKYGN